MVYIVHKDRVFKLTEITKIFNINRHFVIHLVETQVILPLKDIKGRGQSRSYSYVNVLEIGIFIYLKKLDISHDRAGQILAALRPYLPGPINVLSYISIIGFLDETKPQSYIDVDIRHNLSLEQFLKKAIKVNREMKLDRGILGDDFAYYFILDVRNIIRYIDSKITKL
jgi:hypothetical protein